MEYLTTKSMLVNVRGYAMIRMDIEISIFILNTLLYYISSLRCLRVAHAHDYVYSHPQRSELSTYSMVLY